MSITGTFTSAKFPDDLARKSFPAIIMRAQPNGTAPLTAITSLLKSETALNTIHGYWQTTETIPTLKLNGAIADGTTTEFVVDSTDSVIPGAIMRVESTEENVLILNIISSTKVSVRRGVGSVAAAAIDDDSELYQVSNVAEESSVRPTAQSNIPTQVTNLTQILRNTWSVSRTAAGIAVLAGENVIIENKRDAMARHAKTIESALFFSQKYSGTLNGQPVRTMEGLLANIGDAAKYPPIYAGGTNIFTASATTNWTQLEGYLDPVFHQTTDPKSANERLLFCGATAKKVINNIGRLNGNYQLVDGQTNFGLNFKTLTTSRGIFRIIEHPLFNSNSIWSKMAVTVDLSTFNVAYLVGGRTTHKGFNEKGDQAADNGIDAVGGTFTTELTAVVKNTPANGVVFNLTDAAQG